MQKANKTVVPDKILIYQWRDVNIDRLTGKKTSEKTKRLLDTDDALDCAYNKCCNEPTSSGGINLYFEFDWQSSARKRSVEEVEGNDDITQPVRQHPVEQLDNNDNAVCVFFSQELTSFVHQEGRTGIGGGS